MVEYKRVWLPYKIDMNVENSSGFTITSFAPVDGDETEKADQEIRNLLDRGWEIASTAPVTKSVCFLNSEADDTYATYTSGIEVFMIKN